MSQPDPSHFATPGSSIGNLAHQLRQIAGRSSSTESGDRLDLVGVLNFSTLMEAMADDGVRLSPVEAQRYLRQVLCQRDPNNADLYEGAALELSVTQRLVISSNQGQDNTRQQARDKYRAAAVKDIRDWRQAHQPPAPPPSEDGSNAETTHQADAAQTEDHVPCPQCKAPMEPMDARATQWRCPHPHGENGRTTWRG